MFGDVAGWYASLLSTRAAESIFQCQANVPQICPPVNPDKTIKSQRDGAGHIIGQNMQGKLALDTRQSSASEACQALLLT